MNSCQMATTHSLAGVTYLLSNLLTLGRIHLSPKRPGNAALKPVSVNLLHPQAIVPCILASLHVEVGTDLS